MRNLKKKRALRLNDRILVWLVDKAIRKTNADKRKAYYGVDPLKP